MTEEQPKKAPSPEELEAKAVVEFRQKIADREEQTGVQFESAVGFVKVDGETYRVKVQVREPTDTSRAEARAERKHLEIRSGRQYKKFRKARARRLREYEKSTALAGLVKESSSDGT